MKLFRLFGFITGVLAASSDSNTCDGSSLCSPAAGTGMIQKAHVMHKTSVDVHVASIDENVASPKRGYQHGQPGGPWSPEMQFATRAKLIRVFQEGIDVTREMGIQPDSDGTKVITVGKVLRLGFHSCMKDIDGGGGCDGCVAWDGVGQRFVGTDMKKGRFDYYTAGEDNNGLETTMEILEKIYMEPDFPRFTPALTESLHDSGVSRADFWAFAAKAAVEFGMVLNNLVCDKDPNDGSGLFKQCHPRQGQDDCKVLPIPTFNFSYGRIDCSPDSEGGLPYKKTRVEVHPHPSANGEKTYQFFQTQFGFTPRETVAIMGSHTMGKFHAVVSLHQYTWTTRSGMLFNNGYYRNIVDKPDWYYPTGSFANGTKIRTQTCVGFGDSTGERPPSHWTPHPFNHLDNGGPAQWLQFKRVCQCWDDDLTGFSAVWAYKDDKKKKQAKKKLKKAKKAAKAAGTASLLEEEEEWVPEPIYSDDGCCTYGDYFGCMPGCEKYRIVVGADETMLNADIGLYIKFNVTNAGIPTGCPGLDRQTDAPDDEDESHFHRCPHNEIQSDGDLPMHEIVQLYADDHDAFYADFLPTFEKMLSNGFPNLTMEAMAAWDCPQVVDTDDRSRFYDCSAST